MAKVLSVRLDDELEAWLAAYSRERGVKASQVVKTALASLRDDAGRSVPDLEQEPSEPAVPNRAARAGSPSPRSAPAEDPDLERFIQAMKIPKIARRHWGQGDVR